MNIELTDPKTVRITWPSYDAATEAEIAKRLNTVPGIEGMGHRYWCSAIHVARLMDLFPRASFDYRALQAADATARTFHDAMVRMGVALAIDASRAIVAVGENVSPLVQSLVDERAHALRPLVVEDMAQPRREPRPQPQRPAGPLTQEEGKWETWLNGIHNAAAKEELEKVKYPKRRRKSSKPTQKGLGL